MTRPTILDSENVALLDLTPSGRAKPAWAAAAEKAVAQQMANLTASVMRHAGDDDPTAWDDVRKYVETLEVEAKCDEEYLDLVKDKYRAAEARIAELEKRLADAERVISKQRDALRPISDAVFNDNGDITVNLSRPSDEEFIAAYFADRAARAYMEGK